jgi:hypothetical protein
VTRNLAQASGRRQGGFLEPRVHSLDLGEALLEIAPFFPEFAQLLGEYLVVIHVRT